MCLTNNIIPTRVSRLHLSEAPIFDREKHKGSCAVPLKTNPIFFPSHMSLSWIEIYQTAFNPQGIQYMMRNHPHINPMNGLILS